MERQRPTDCENRDDACAQAIPEPCASDVRAQLDRILASATFSVPERVRQFLAYVVNQTLEGRADRIKAYTVAVEVFGRDANFDIQNDPVVRIEAGRLRRALERYYLLGGSADPVLLEIPKGGYVPRFHWQQHHAEDGETVIRPGLRLDGKFGTAVHAWLMRHWLVGAVAVATMAAAALVWIVPPSQPSAFATRLAQPGGPSLIVKPFVNLSRDTDANYYAAGIGEELLAQLARFKELTVFGRETSDSLSADTSAPEIRRRFGNRYVLEGSVRLAEGKLRVTSRVLDGETSAVVWSGAYDADPRTNNIVDIEMTIASKVATAIAQPYGIIFSTPPPLARGKTSQGMEAYRCSYLFYRYRTVLDQNEHAPTRDCLEQLTASYPDHATGWAMLSYLYLDEDRFRLNPRPGSPTPIERARAAAERAVRLDPENVRALQALMTILYFSKEPAEALRIGSQALALNPNDTELLGEFGSRVAQAGEWQRGAALLEDAMSRNPGHSDYYIGLLALAAYMQGDDPRAADLIRRANLRRFSIYHFVAALIFARLELETETAHHRTEFLRLRPGFFDDFDGELDKRNFNPRDRAILLRGAIQAGFPVQSRFAAGVE
ncbi:adenylate cyclase [Bosea sp. 124]|uniref:adenylate cyclase n=1 Tax=Bosea sp. 124 TaxID=2135642 RepID=UPI000D4970D1|nr:adenylate cyclase [Bosea sp. 124]PTM42850.1 TolB-like protein [Bosea sp. 124]